MADIQRQDADDVAPTRIIIQAGDVFDGTPEQFTDAFFSNVTEASVRTFADSQGWSVEFRYEGGDA